MRILHLISSLAGGGAEVFVRDLCVSLAQCEQEVAIAYISSAADQGTALEIEREFLKQLNDAGVGVFEIGHACRRNPILGALRVKSIVRSFRPDVLHLHLGYGIMFRSMMFLKLPTVYTHHSIRFKFGYVLTAWFNLFVDTYVGICKTCATVLREKTSKPIVTIRNGISSRRVAPSSHERGQQKMRVISVGSIREAKNYESLIRIAGILKRRYGLIHQDIEFLVCGDGAEIERLRALVVHTGVDDIVHFLGARTDVPELMASSDVLLMTSIYEGMPISLIEAAHAGLPMIVTSVGGCPEIVEHDINGYLFEPNDDDAAASFLDKLLRETALRNEMSLKSRLTASEFGMEIVTERHLKLYRTLTTAA